MIAQRFIKSQLAAEFADQFVEADGVKLHVEVSGSGEPVLILHGFTGSARAMRPLAAALPGYQRICVDLLGHGESDHPDQITPYRVEACIKQLLAILDHFQIERAHLFGYSMGGRIALAFAVAAPKRVLSLTAIGASAGIAREEERKARREADEKLADSILRDGMDAFVEHWSNLPLFASQRKYLSDEARDELRKQRLANSPQGLAMSLRGAGVGAQEPLHDKLSTLTLPVLLCAGEEDAKFRMIASELAAAIPSAQAARAQVAAIPRAGHAAHLENPNAFLDLWKKFLASATKHFESNQP